MFTWPRGGGDHSLTPDGTFWSAIATAESRRGNRYRLLGGDARDRRGRMVFRYPIDRDAVLAEFELAPGMVLGFDPEPTLFYYSGEAGALQWAMISGSHDVGGRRRRRLHAAWWSEWNAAPRPRVLLVNPFAPSA